MMQDQMIDWISFGCMLAEFISGMNPFRSEKALNFGLTKTNDQLQSSSSGSKNDQKRAKARMKTISLL